MIPPEWKAPVEIEAHPVATVTLAVALADPLVAVIVAVPSATEVTSPVEETVAAPPVAAHVTVAPSTTSSFASVTVAVS